MESHPGPASSRPTLVTPARGLSAASIGQAHFHSSLWHAWLCPHHPVVPRDWPGLRSCASCGSGAEPQSPARLPGAGLGWSQVPVTRRELQQQHGHHPTCGWGSPAGASQWVPLTAGGTTLSGAVSSGRSKSGDQTALSQPCVCETGLQCSRCSIAESLSEQ